MSENITMKKSDLWRYATFVLLAVVVIGAIIIFSGGSNGNAVNNTATGKVSLDAFLSNSVIYPSLGPEDAENVVIEFSDFQCPFCAMASGLPSWAEDYKAQYGALIGSAQTVQEMAANGELRFVYVPWSFLGQESIYAAEAALCANEQGRFWEMHDAIFTAHDSHENNGKYNKDELKTIAEGISGIDTAKFNDCLENDNYLASLQKIDADVRAAGVTGTPTFFVNGQKVAASSAAIQAALN